MKKRLNLIVLIGEVACIVVLHSIKTNHGANPNQSFAQKFINFNKIGAAKSIYTLSSLK